jgi:hypothetical protein
LYLKVIGLPEFFILDDFFNINVNNFGIIQDITHDLYIITGDKVSKVIKDPFPQFYKMLFIKQSFYFNKWSIDVERSSGRKLMTTKMSNDYRMSNTIKLYKYADNICYCIDRSFIVVARESRLLIDAFKGYVYAYFSTYDNNYIGEEHVKVNTFSEVPLYYRASNIVVFITRKKFISVDYDKDAIFDNPTADDYEVPPPNAYNYYEIEITNSEDIIPKNSILTVLRKVTFQNRTLRYNVEKKFVYIDYKTISKNNLSTGLLKMFKIQPSNKRYDTGGISKSKHKMRKSLVDLRITENVDPRLQRFVAKK